MTSPFVAEVLVLLMAGILAVVAVISAERMRPRTSVILLTLALASATLVALRRNGWLQ
jgi:hypothetical protein